MSPNFMVFLLLVVVTATVGKYVYVPEKKNWFDAQKHCQTTYTDLAPINNEHDKSLIQELNPSIGLYSWIGLTQNTTRNPTWMWSGGREVFPFFWAPGQPNNILGEDYGAIINSNQSWIDAPASFSVPFICYKVHVVRERKTWDEALQYCRKHHRDLASVATETEKMLIEKELSKDYSSPSVWIGLQFLAGDWHWIDGQAFTYESWGLWGRATCPDITQACGALQLLGPLKLVGLNLLVKEGPVGGWNALDCNFKLHFLCY